MTNILIVDDEETLLHSLLKVFQRMKHKVSGAYNGGEAIERVKRAAFDVALVDVRLPDMDGLSLLRLLRDVDPDLQVILMTAFADVKTAVEAIKSGAFHYIHKPFDLEELKVLIEKAIETKHLKGEVRRLREQDSESRSGKRLIGESAAIKRLKELVAKVSMTPRTSVLITGESGTGKELVANAIHYESSRCDAPLIKINCSAIPEALLESELFGHERGAFTDARQRKKGLFEIANGGSIFLDEISEMAYSIQPKLLRFLETQSFRRVGGLEDVEVDVRVIAATNKDLSSLIAKGLFREDLYYRLKVMVIEVPPLRHRREDILLLANLFLEEADKELGRPIQSISEAAQDRLLAYSWPGNVRELKNVMERAAILSEGAFILPEHLPIELRFRNGSLREQSLHEDLSLKSIERAHIRRVLEICRGNKSETARRLGISRSTLKEKIKSLGIIQ